MRPQPAVAVLATGTAAQLHNQFVVFVAQAKNFLSVADLSQIQEGLDVQVGVAAVTPNAAANMMFLTKLTRGFKVLLKSFGRHNAVFNNWNGPGVAFVMSNQQPDCLANFP